MIRQAHPVDPVLVEYGICREMTGRTQTLLWWLGKRGIEEVVFVLSMLKNVWLM
jgi:hypothetical protein